MVSSEDGWSLGIQLVNWLTEWIPSINWLIEWIDRHIQQRHKSWYISVRSWCSVYCCMKRRHRGFPGYMQVCILFSTNESINPFPCSCFYVCGYPWYLLWQVTDWIFRLTTTQRHDISIVFGKLLAFYSSLKSFGTVFSDIGSWKEDILVP